MSNDLYDIPVQTVDGKTTTLASYRNKVLLIVNVASLCGFTKQYAELEALYREEKARGLVVLGFPCDQFLHQEPGSNEEIKAFAESCFRVTFPMFAKIDVKGPTQSPLYAYLGTHMEKKPFFFVPWNFTKILVNAEGQVLRRYLPTTSIQTIRKTMASLMAVEGCH